MRTLKQFIPLLSAIVVLELFFRFGVPYISGGELRFWPGLPKFWTLEVHVSIADQIAVTAILASGMTLAIIIGGIDLSVGAVVALAGTTTVFLLGLRGGEAQSVPWLVLAIFGGMAVAGFFGGFNGVCAAKTKMPPFIITLSTMLIARGCALRFNEGRPIPIGDHETLFLALGNGKIHLPFLDVPYSVVVMLAVFGLAAVLLHRTRFGQHVYAIGGNREAARYAGIPIARVEILVYLICSLLTGLAGMIHCSQLYAAEPGSGEGFELDAIAAAVVGGTSFTGGKGTMAGTLIGAVIIGLLNSGLNQAGVHYSFQYIIKGFVILAAVYLDVRPNAVTRAA